MSDITIGKEDEQTIIAVIEKGLGVRVKRDASKWVALRLALAISLRQKTPPDEKLDHVEDRKEGNSYHLEQVTGKGLYHNDDEPRKDYDDAICALLSVYHELDLFADQINYKRLLQRHIRRGLREFRTGWCTSHDFHQYLLQEIFGGEDTPKTDTGLGDKMIAALKDIGVKADLRETLEGPRLTRFMFYLAVADDYERTRKGLEKLAYILGLGEQSLTLSRIEEERVVALDVPRQAESWKAVSGDQLVQWIDDLDTNDTLPVWPGVDALGKPFRLDLAKMPHLFVGGTTGSGKSVCINAIIVSLLRGPARDRLQLCLIDTKRVEFEPYSRLDGLFGREVVTEAEQAVEILDELVQEMEQRTQQLAKNEVRDLIEAHNKGRLLDVPYIVAIVEELADLLAQQKLAEQSLERLASKARATGIHLVLATQRPDAATFSGQLRSNIPSRIALTVQKASESRIILDDVGAERLTGKGDMLIKIGQKTSRVHGVKITQDDIASAIARYQRRS